MVLEVNFSGAKFSNKQSKEKTISEKECVRKSSQIVCGCKILTTSLKDPSNLFSNPLSVIGKLECNYYSSSTTFDVFQGNSFPTHN